MTFQSETHVKRGRKPHRCDYCGGTIPAGAPSVKNAGRWDGDFYTARGHLDCLDLWNKAYQTYADDYEGMPFDLREAIAGDEGREIVEYEFNAWRGHYPHVICRLELRLQRADIKYSDYCRSLGFQPDPEDCPEVYG